MLVIPCPMIPPQPSDLISTGAISPSELVLLAEGELAKHSHYVGKGKGNEKNPAVYNQFLYLTQWEGKYEYDISTDTRGGDNPHNNLPPVYGVYRFRRVK